MLASIISLLQDDEAAVQPRPPTVHVDRGGGGGTRFPPAAIQDYLAAVQSFRDIPGESPVARAVRRTDHIGRELVRLREGREATDNEQKAMAAGVLWGAYLERAAAADHDQDKAAMPSLPTTVQKDPVAPLSTVGHQRGHHAQGGTAVAIVLGIGFGAVLIAMRRRR